MIPKRGCLGLLLYTPASPAFPVPPAVTGQSSPEKGGEDKHVSSKRTWTTEEVPGTQVKHRVQGAIWNRAGRNQSRLEDTRTSGAGLMLARGLDVCVSKGILHSCPMPPREGNEGMGSIFNGLMTAGSSTDSQPQPCQRTLTLLPICEPTGVPGPSLFLTMSRKKQ